MMNRWDALRSPPTTDKGADVPAAQPTWKRHRQRGSGQQESVLSSREEKKDSEVVPPLSRSSQAHQRRDWRPQRSSFSTPVWSGVRPHRIASPPCPVGATPRYSVPHLSYVERGWIVGALKNELFFFRGNGGSCSLSEPVIRDCVNKLRMFSATETSEVVHLLVDLLQIPYADVDDLAATALEERLEAASRNSTLFFTQPQALHLARRLSFYCSVQMFRHHRSYARLLRCLAMFVKSNRTILPGEETAQNVVGNIFLPYIESDSLRGSIAVEEIYIYTKTYFCVCETTKLLLLDPKHSSALLAPLVNDVSMNDGKEEQSINPLRSRLLAGFGKSLMRLDYERADEQLEACYALATAVRIIEMLDASIGVIPGEGSNLVQSLQSFILDVLKETDGSSRDANTFNVENLRSGVLQLLKGMISLYPGAVTGLGWKLIVTGPESTFLPCLINTNPTRTVEIETTVRAIECLTGFASALPWKIWLEQDPRKTTILSPSITSSSSGLYRAASTALETLLQIALSSFQLCENCTILDALGSLLRLLFNEIPFCNGKLVQAGEDLWASLSSYVFDPNENRHKRCVANDVVTASLGGTTTPQGQLVPACIPALLWLIENESASVSFLDKVIESIKNDDYNSEDSVKLLSAMLRTLPDLAFKRWEGFRNLLERLSENGVVERSLVCLELLRAFKTGKRDFGFQMKHEESKNQSVLELACLVLDRTFSLLLKDRTAPVAQWRLLTLAVYAAFIDEDWRLVDATEGEILRHLNRMLEWCQYPVATVREAACKAVGEFCTQYGAAIGLKSDQADTKIQQYRLIFGKICHVMLQVCKDPNAGARSMSIFALGNLVYELRGSNHKLLLNQEIVSEICEAILEGLGDKNDKVVGNSIRSLGHSGNLLVRCLLDSHEGGNSVSLRLLNRMVCSFADKISIALDVALNTTSKSSLTWKQRSAAKKHGWGACHSLGLVFQACTVEITQIEPDLASSCREALKQLVLCCAHREKINEKVVVGAMAAIRSIPRPVLVEASRESGLVGDALASSVSLFYDTLMLEIGRSFNLPEFKALDDKLTKQNQQLLNHLLRSASINDAHKVLKDDRVSTQTLHALYTWMVDQEDGVLDGSSFEIFALALQRPGLLCDNVALELKFASRATQKYKNDQHTRADGPRDGSDGADEL